MIRSNKLCIMQCIHVSQCNICSYHYGIKGKFNIDYFWINSGKHLQAEGLDIYMVKKLRI